MKIKEGFVLRTICQEHIVTGEGLAQVNFNKNISLNESAAWLWEQVSGNDFSEEDLARLLLDRYDVAPEVASADAGRLVKSWQDAGLIEA